VTIDRNCLDAETVAAWMDGGLDAAGVAAAEAHASTCERCQALLATVAKTLPADVGHAPAGARLWKWWLAPLAATAAAVTIWMVVPQTPMQTPAQPPAATAPARDVAEAPATPQPQPAPASAREQSGELRRDKPAEPGAQATVPATPAPPATVSDFRRNVPAPAAEEGKATLAADADTAASARERSGELRRDEQAKREENSVRAAEMRQAAEPAAAAERAREAPAEPSVGAVTQLRKQTGPLQIVSPDPNSRWRALPGVVERSEDGGRIWIPVRLGAKEEVIGGASPRPLVCWLVGRNGLVLLATDGTNFTRLPFPESVDLVAVSSPEPRIATVSTADGRVYRTDDGGRTWRIL
jgi:hypothetical protein